MKITDPPWEVRKDKAGCSTIVQVKTGYEIASHLDKINADYIVAIVNETASICWYCRAKLPCECACDTNDERKNRGKTSV